MPGRLRATAPGEEASKTDGRQPPPATPHIKLEIKPGTDAQTRTAAALAALFMIADIFIDPPKGGNHGDGGAPQALEMER